MGHPSAVETVMQVGSSAMSSLSSSIPKRKFDVVIADPPAFVKSKKEQMATQLVRQAVVRPAGLLGALHQREEPAAEDETIIADSWGPEDPVFVEQHEEVVDTGFLVVGILGEASRAEDGVLGLGECAQAGLPDFLRGFTHRLQKLRVGHGFFGELLEFTKSFSCQYQITLLENVKCVEIADR